MFGSPFTTPKPHPEEKKTTYPRCANCDSDWHGLPTETCSGSHNVTKPPRPRRYLNVEVRIDPNGTRVERRYTDADAEIWGPDADDA
jgi:hypothetical protein